MQVDCFCNECGVPLSADNWWPSSQKKQWHKCSKCSHARNKRYDQANPDVSLRKNIKKYGIDDKQYHELSDKQNGLCAICFMPEKVTGRARLAVDHCHTTGRIRGLLCNSCNIALGKFQDDIQRLRRAEEYLLRWT